MEGEAWLKSPCQIYEQLVNNELCIIRQHSGTENLKSAKNGRRRVIEAASKNLDVIWEQLRNYGGF